ncbi:MAG: SiaB family protein kinase [Salinivirgaceae bacterium]|nr:SiaB family protein kinase [Salinivirgaceae bacterium]MBR4620243.1 SiaB family protein kinase [Salinivirgaceae bacterium]
MNDYKQLLAYDGEITFDKIEEILTLFNQKMPDTNNPVCKIRLFSIMVEGLENAYRHNFDSPEQNPQIKVRLMQNGNKYVLSIGNRIDRTMLKQLTDRIDELNQLTQNEVKKLYNKTIHHGQITEKGGAGLGLMKILRSSREPIKYTVTDIDSECSFIDLTISITDSAKQ